ncbi:DUF397 domain-containing protein [Streptomyces sp. NPDC093589]|uniref:DUF397 domain-containing protein n=1 Tax=Streptomyces sp. NPDC093589 TaxID=3366043 RepID=UPI00382FE4AC
MDIQWRKSSYSTDADGTNCIELAALDGDILIRESDDPGVIVKTTPTKLRAFLVGAKAGEFDDLM